MNTLMSQPRAARRLQRGSSLALVFVALLNVGQASMLGKKRAPASSRLAARGLETFRSRCAACHGLDGRGGEHAPDIVTNPKVRELSDRALFEIIDHGVPRAGMPAFGLLLEPDEIRTVVTYLRRAGGKGSPARVPGDPTRGEELFFGKAGCSACHMVRGRGGFLGADLSDYGRDHSPAQIRAAILHPSDAFLPGQESVTATTRDGRELAGVIRNEDNFSLQLLDTKGVFHLLMKSDLASVKREPRSMMPGDYASRLSAKDLDDLVSYVVRTSSQPPAPAASKRGSAPGVDR